MDGGYLEDLQLLVEGCRENFTDECKVLKTLAEEYNWEFIMVQINSSSADVTKDDNLDEGFLENLEKMAVLISDLAKNESSGVHDLLSMLPPP